MNHISDVLDSRQKLTLLEICRNHSLCGIVEMDSIPACCLTMYTRHLKTVVGGLVLATILTLLLFTTTPAPTTFLLSAANSIRYDFLSPQAVGGEQCLPHQHIFFLKTHKCASSTVQNIFLRYGYNNNLTFALPGQANYLGNPSKFQASMIPRKFLSEDGKVDIFAVHTRLNVPEHAQVLHNDTRWITIVRDPATLYESLFNFYHMNNAYGLKLTDYASEPMSNLMKLHRYGGKFGRNQMLFDLGYAENASVTELLTVLEDLDNLFDLVMISELMDESLILLRHLLCWSLHDIVVFTKNARRQEVKSTLDHKTIKTLRILNSADALLYDHFLARHQRAVYEFGIKRMADEVASLRGLRDEYYEDCGTREVKGKDSSLQFKEYSGLVSAYITANNSDENCVLMSLPELPLVDRIRRHQLIMHGYKAS